MSARLALRAQAFYLAMADTDRERMIAMLTESNTLWPNATPEQIEQAADEARAVEDPRAAWEQTNREHDRQTQLREFEEHQLKIERGRVVAIEQEGTDEDAAWFWRVRHQHTGEKVRVGPFTTTQMMRFEPVRGALGAQADIGASQLVGRDPLTAYWQRVQSVKTVIAVDADRWAWLRIELRDLVEELRFDALAESARHGYEPQWDRAAERADEGESAADFVRRRFDDAWNDTHESRAGKPGAARFAADQALRRMPIAFYAQDRLHISESAFYKFVLWRFKATGQGQRITLDHIKRGLRGLGFAVGKKDGLRVQLDLKDGRPRRDRYWAVSPEGFEPDEG